MSFLAKWTWPEVLAGGVVVGVAAAVVVQIMRPRMAAGNPMNDRLDNLLREAVEAPDDYVDETPTGTGLAALLHEAAIDDGLDEDVSDEEVAEAVLKDLRLRQ